MCISVCVRVTFGRIREATSKEVQTPLSVRTKRETDSQHPATILPLPVIIVGLWEFSVIVFVRLIPSIMQHFQFTLLLELVILHTGVIEFNCQLRRVNTSIRILLLEFPCMFFRQLPQFGMHALLYGCCSLVCSKSCASTCYFFTFLFFQTLQCRRARKQISLDGAGAVFLGHKPKQHTQLSVNIVYISDLLGICRLTCKQEYSCRCRACKHFIWNTVLIRIWTLMGVCIKLCM